MKIIPEEMKYRKKMCEFAKKYGVTKSARNYHTNRKFVYRQLEKYDKTDNLSDIIKQKYYQKQ